MHHPPATAVVLIVMALADDRVLYQCRPDRHGEFMILRNETQTSERLLLRLTALGAYVILPSIRLPAINSIF
jgi:hypothetical protein